MKDYYELLGVTKNASIREIKRGYRKVSLKCHPDLFQTESEMIQKEKEMEYQLIQKAYETLSDDHARAYYDEYGEDQGNLEDGQEPDDLLDLSLVLATLKGKQSWFSLEGFFSFKKVDLEGDAFYEKISQIFQKLVLEEQKYAQDKRKRRQEPFVMPGFGDAESSEQDVLNFYKEWQKFRTQKSFSWRKKWHYNPKHDDVNHFQRREMDKENEKERNNAKKEFNNEVLEFVQWVKDRDTRYSRIMRDREAIRRQKRLEQEQIEAKEKLWRKQIKESLRESDDHKQDLTHVDESLADDLESFFEATSKKKKKKDIPPPPPPESSSNEENDGEKVDDDSFFYSKKKKKPKAEPKRSKKKKKKKTRHRPTVDDVKVEIVGDLDESPTKSSKNHQETLNQFKAEQVDVPNQDAEQGDKVGSGDDSVSTTSESQKILTKAERRKLRKEKKKEKKKEKGIDVDQPFVCKVCKSGFGSKSKLFKHIRNTGHAALK